MERNMLAIALENIAERAAQRRREAIHDALLIAGAAVSGGIAAAGGVFLWLLTHGRI